MESLAPIRRTKIVATLGPSTRPPERLAALLDGGVNVCRLNFSHGTLGDHGQMLQHIRAWATEKRRCVAVLGDLCGPKIRLNTIRGGSLAIATGQEVRFVRGDQEGGSEGLTTTFPTLVEEVRVGQRIYIDDGAVRLLVIDRTPDALICTCKDGGAVSTRKGVNLPDTRLTVPALTEKDRVDLDWAIQSGLDYVALSFVRKPADLIELRDILKSRKATTAIIAKIEKVEALEHLDELIGLADGIMVARGDMGVEMDVWSVPLVQKSITARCRIAGKPVIIATQMLQSMMLEPSPTRAEVSDVANAVLDGVDAIMLSGETASGQFPLAAVEVMSQTARSAEAFRDSPHAFPISGPADALSAAPLTGRRTESIAQAAAQAATHLGARLIAAWTATGETVRRVSRLRLPLPIVGLTFDERVYRRMALWYGVMPLLVDVMDSPTQMMHELDRVLRTERLAESGDLIVVVSSTQPTRPGETDMVLVRRVT